MTARRSDPLQISQASLGNQAKALELALGHLASDIRQPHIAQIIAEAMPGPVPGLWVASRKGELRGTVMAQIQPGKAALISRPQLAPQEPRETARLLMTRMLADLPRKGVQLAQVLLDEDHGPDAELFRSLEFRHAANLLHMVSLDSAFPTTVLAAGLEFVAYSVAEHDRLTRLVERTYTDSLDCPEIDGVREIEDVLAGYRAVGTFDPSRWLIVSDDNQDVGCLILTDHARDRQWELIYLGVVPEARGRGLGLALTRHAQRLAGQAGRQRLMLAVDAANQPAIDAYRAAGFIVWGHRSVFLHVFPKAHVG
jgi:mycothiol synthase